MAMDVPYLAQTDALCGGAAAAMVFRYWGDVHADPQEFAPIVDRRAGGIANGALVDAVRRRGWQAVELAGGSADLQARLAARQPVVVLIADRGPRYHYVVAVGKTADAVVIHDPAWGPSRAINDVEFDRIWRASGNWGLVILPPPAASFPDSPSAPSARVGSTTLKGSQPESRCESLLAAALDDIRASGDAAFDRADDVLDRVRQACPQSAGPLRELAGVRFAQRRWQDAAALSRAALVREPTDAYALDVLGSSLFMQDDQVGALRAWNRIDRPRVNLVRIAGVRHTRHQTVAETLGIQPNMLLTADLFEHARRRLEALPDRSTVRLALRPEADGFASIDVVVVERSGVPRTTADWTAVGARALATQSVAVTLPGGTGQGELWSAEWRFWQNRPRVGMAFETPGWAGFPVCGASIRSGNGRASRRPEPRRSARSRNRGCTARSRSVTGSRRGSGIRSAAASIRGTATERQLSLAARSNDAGSGIGRQSTCTRTTGSLLEARGVFSRPAGGCTFARRRSREDGSLSRPRVPIA